MKPKEKIWNTVGRNIAPHLIIFLLISDTCNGQCFGGTETYEKTTGVIFVFGTSQGLLTQPGTGITRDCTAICRQTPSCSAFIVDYELSRCQSYTMDSTGHRNSLQEKVGTNFFEKICLRGVVFGLFPPPTFLDVSNLNAMCGDRLWAFERVLGAYLEGFDDREERNVQSKTECEKLCLFETSFTCRSAEYDEAQNICRLSREDRRSQPNAFRRQVGGTVDYLENQCVRPLPDCRYNVRQDSAVLSMDELQFAASQGECEALCDQARGFTCRAYTYAADEKRCYLSGDDSISLNNAPLMTKRGALYAEKQCSVSHCEDGLFTFEKVTGHFLRSAQQVGLSMAASPGITLECSSRCLDSGSDCPAFSLDYGAMKCFKLDRNTQGRGSELSAREGQSYFEKICLRGKVHVCAGRAWAFERRPGKELRGHDNSKVSLVQSRRDCMEACLAERLFECRSAEYDTATAECRLSSEDRRTKPTDYVDAPATVEYLENQCVTPETRCNFEAVPNSYPRYLDKVIPSVSDDMDCERRCFGSKDFICRSFSYHPSNNQCFLSGDDRASAGIEALMNRPGTNYYERNCRNKNPSLPGGPPIDQGTLFGRPDFEYRPGSINGRCLVGRMEYEKVTGFELTGERGYSLMRERVPGITMLCTRRCQADPRCSAFNLDYTTSECIALTAVSDASRIDLRPTPGVAYFEGICLRRGGCGLTWTFERVPNYELRGFEGARFQGISKTECEEKCLDERKFNCRSASYNFRRHECRLSPEDRLSQPHALIASLDTDYLENACAAPPIRCQYRNQQRDRALLYVDKSLNAFSDSSCQHACDVEREFVCRSFTFLSQTGLNTNQCLLSGDMGSLVGREGFQPQSGAMFAEKECVPANLPGGHPPFGAVQPVGPAPYPGPSGIPPFGGPGGQYYPNPGYNRPPYPGPSASGPYPPQRPYQGYPSGGGGPPYNNPRYGPERTPTGGVYNLPGSGPSALPPPVGPGYPGVIDAGVNGIYTDPDLAPYPCRHTLTYEKVAGAMYSHTRREPLRTRVDVGITAQCLVECAQQRDRCLAVSLENVRGGRQRCYGLERSADSENAPLQPAPDLGYFQKICLRERPCAKAWAFTRVPSYELAVANAIEVRNVYSRRQCQDECLRASRVICRSATYYSRDRVCKISADTRRTQPESFRRSSADVDYMENECAPQPANCEYTDYPGRFLPYSDRYVARTFDITECRRLCDQEREFQCRSFNFHSLRRECYLSSDDTFTADKAALVNDPDFFYSERGSCSNVRVDCTQSDMLVTFMFAAPFDGRVYATGNPQACFEMGSAQNQIVLRIPMGTQCGTVQQGRGRYVNHVVIQQNPVIMQETDKTVRVECSFDASDQTVSFAPQGTRNSEGGGISVSVPFRPSGTNIVTNTAPVPKVRMRIVMRSGQEASIVGLGEELQLRIEIDPTSAFGIFARNLEARTDNGELLTLIDNVGCPRDPNIFPALVVERGSRNLFVDFKAFRFPSTSTVNFVATVQFCQDICEPIKCYDSLPSYGKRRRRNADDLDRADEETAVPTSVTISSTAETTSSSEAPTTKATTTSEKLDMTTEGGTFTEASMIASMNNASLETNAATNISATDELEGELPPGYPNGGNWNEDEQQQLNSVVLPSPSQEVDEKKEPLPSELPLQLRLVVGEDSLPNPGTNNNSNPGGRNRAHIINSSSVSSYGMYPLGNNVYTEDGYICTPSSTIIASTITAIFFHVGLVAGFIFFYRTKKQHWRKLAGLDEAVSASASAATAAQSAIFSPEVLFRSVYDRLPPHHAFTSLGTLGREHPAPQHSSSPANTPPEMLQ